ncbi:NAD-P-binding protein [Multifurca ochricompacta]|uniref:NAD-P-binding protein n=1 Tax=Multifurca ochricompacta TaxID=376703 RepID=A0AAD4LWC9_9AGAM|nr:NAD-P-binding protein [Multifurca ochricompacta]
MSDRGPSPLRPPMTPFRVESLISPIDSDLHPVIHQGRVAVITGAASGIGRAAARELAKLGLKVAIADIDAQALALLAEELSSTYGETNVLAVPTDVSELDEVLRLRDRVYEAWGEVAVLLNNAAIGVKSNSFGSLDKWKKLMNVNLFGVLNVQHTFVPTMLYQENQSVIINTGSKQGITNPPHSGNPAYNASKAAIKSLTESLSHELRELPHVNVTAHLFIPGWTWTGLTAGEADQDNIDEKPAGAWTALETVQYMLDRVRSGDFYILVPDNETRREVDQLRILWSAGDIVEGRPAMSRWHQTYKPMFEEYIKEGLAQLP